MRKVTTTITMIYETDDRPFLNSHYGNDDHGLAQSRGRQRSQDHRTVWGNARAVMGSAGEQDCQHSVCCGQTDLADRSLITITFPRSDTDLESAVGEIVQQFAIDM